jgi:hypothetical protein
MVDTTSLQQSAGSGARSARSTAARPGLIGRGLFYLLFGLLALDLAFGSSESSQGAVERVASAPFGRFLLIGLTVSLLSLVAWKVLQAIIGDPVEGSEATDRIKYTFKALTYAGLAATSVTLLIANWDSSSSSGTSASGSDSSNDTQTEATATVLEWPAGQWLVVIGGLAIVGVAIYTAYKYAIEAEFRQRLDTSSLSQSTQQGVDWIGRAGYAGKALISAVIGMFLVIAGLRHDPGETEGLSGALRSLSESGWGTALLVLVGVGLFLFAAFSFVEAAYRRST